MNGFLSCLQYPFYNIFLRIFIISSICFSSMISGGTSRMTLSFALMISSPSSSARLMISPAGFLTLSPCISPFPLRSSIRSDPAASASNFSLRYAPVLHTCPTRSSL